MFQPFFGFLGTCWKVQLGVLGGAAGKGPGIFSWHWHEERYRNAAMPGGAGHRSFEKTGWTIFTADCIKDDREREGKSQTFDTIVV